MVLAQAAPRGSSKIVLAILSVWVSVIAGSAVSKLARLISPVLSFVIPIFSAEDSIQSTALVAGCCFAEPYDVEF